MPFFSLSNCLHTIYIDPGSSFLLSQIVKIFSEDGMGKVVEIPADMTARDLCQLLVYKSHCVDDNSWALVEHHPLLGLGKKPSPAGLKHCSDTHNSIHHHTWTGTRTFIYPHRDTRAVWWAETCNTVSDSHRCISMHACLHAWVDGTGTYSHADMFSSMTTWVYYMT